MKTRKFNILLILLLFVGFSSCGSDNEVEGDSIVNNTDPVTVPSTDINYLINQVNQLTFNESSNYVYTEFYYNVRQSYSYFRNGFYYQGYHTTSMYRSKEFYNYDNTYAIEHEYGNSFPSVRTGLLNIINTRVSYEKKSDCLWEIVSNDSYRYGIDVCKSMIANPIYKLSNIYTTQNGNYINGQHQQTGYYQNNPQANVVEYELVY